MRIFPLRRTWRTASASLAASVLVTAAHSQVAPLGLQEALALSAARSQQLVADDAAAAAAREQALVASTRPDPVLTAGIDNLPVEGAHAFNLTRDFMTMRSIGIEQELVGESKREAQATFYMREAEAAEAAHSLALATLRQQTAAAWFDRLFTQRATELLVAQRASAETFVTAAEIAYGNGTGSRTDVLAARSASARSGDAIAAMQREVALARARLARWIGDDDALRPLAPPPQIDEVAVHHGNVDEQLALHPDIQLMLRHEAVAAAEADIARAERRPNWTIGIAYQERGSAFDDMVSLNASRPLQWRRAQRQDRLIAAASATASRARAEREEETRAHLLEAHVLIETWASNRARLDRYDAMIVPLAKERVSAATTAYRTGAGSLGDVIDAQTAAIDTELERLALEAETAKVWAELEYLIPDESNR